MIADKDFGQSYLVVTGEKKYTPFHIAEIRYMKTK
jgi:hypothetical protein